ncbi:GntR family transcriptional regulator [Nocardioides sp. Kera G14]|uniref:GntR family transcriptional regulator n=1 Tax=Nocardioides sp. Kera G14 TaxID=2884264 RepID=UPI001D0F7638|nr:GntR family transcriptional regulator [Nocardioides sp. Kera G14]UDY23482.1 GntR family transcriptional regulator [Nocardioides sp. Kera G14]
MIDRSSGVPLYRQIKTILRDEIVTEVTPVDRPMTEEDLIRRFGVSRAPIRQALKELSDEGYVYRERAKGTFPVHGAGRPVRRPDSLRLGGLLGFLRSEGLEPVSRVWDLDLVEPTAEQMERIGLRDDAKLLHFRRLIAVDGEPLAVGQIWLDAPAGFRPSVAELEESGSAFVLLEQQFGVVVARVEHEAWATAASSEAAELLALPEGSPVLEVESRFHTRAGRLVGWRANTHLPDQFKYRFSTNN